MQIGIGLPNVISFIRGFSLGSHLFSYNTSVVMTGTYHVDGLVQDCSNSIANALELLQSCTKPSMCSS